MRFPALAVGVIALTMTACATLNSVLEQRGEQRFNAGIAALRAGNYAEANRQLGWVAEHYPDDELGKRSLLIVSALELDPRNPARRIALGAELAGTYLRQRETPGWTLPLAQTMYLLGLELGAAEEKLALAEAEKAQVERQLDDLPKLPQAAVSVPARLRALQDERDRLAKRVEQLEAQLADRDKKLAEKDKELERIRKTIKS